MSRLRSERGAAAVEFALILPILVMLVFGITEFGRAFQVQATLASAAREGARVMALQNDPVAARTAVRSASTSLGSVLTDAQIAVTPTTCSAAGATVTVTISYQQDFLTGVFGAGVDLTGRGVMRCNG